MTAVASHASESDRHQPAQSLPKSTLGRAYRLLTCFHFDETRLSLSQLSRRSGLPLSTTHRMVTEMVRLGMLDRGRDDLLSIGVNLWRLGVLAGTYGIQRVALPYMQDLYATTGLPIHLAIPQGEHTTVVESLRPLEQRLERPRIGQHDPMHVVGNGMAILAFSDPDLQQRYLARLSPTVAEAVRRELARTRSAGYSVSTRRTGPSIAIGAPVLDRSGRPLAAISIIVPPGSAETPYGHLMRDTASAVQRMAWDQALA